MAGSPVGDSDDAIERRLATVGSASVSDDEELFRDEQRLLARKRTAAIFHASDDASDVLEVLPDESANARVLGTAFPVAISCAIVGRWPLDRDVVDIRNGPLRSLSLEDVGDVVVENGNGVGPTHRKLCETHETIWRLECGIVARVFVEVAIVVADK